jgi:hypothetical protein
VKKRTRTTKRTTTSTAPAPASTSTSAPTSSIDRERLTPTKTREAAEAMFVAMGGRSGVLAVLEGVPDDDTKAAALRNMLMDPSVYQTTSFAKMRQRAGYSAKDVFELFNDRQHATALVVAAAAKPRLVGELVDAASVKRVACDVCGASKRIPEYDDDGDVVGWRQCEVCDENGLVLVDGNAKARELYFGQFGFRADTPLVSIDNRQDNRSVTYVAGGPGSAPNPLTLIKALDQVKDVGGRTLSSGDGVGVGVSSDASLPVIDVEAVK